jgi:hypothetical protein
MLRAKQSLAPLLVGVEKALVWDMNDGGMGSLRFVGKEDRRFGSAPIGALFSDDDGVPVSASVILDRSGALYEVDIWKADNSPLLCIPPPGEIQITAPLMRPNSAVSAKV